MSELPMNSARVIQVIETNLLMRGRGQSEADPVRSVRQYWSLDGELLAEVDPCVTKAVARKDSVK